MKYLVETENYVAITCDLTQEQYGGFRKAYEEYCTACNMRDDLMRGDLLGAMLSGAQIASPPVLPRLTVNFLESWSDIDEMEFFSERMGDMLNATKALKNL